MERSEALKTLGLTDVDVTAETVESASAQRLADIAERRERAPTDKLKEKFAAVEAHIQAARTALLADFGEGGRPAPSAGATQRRTGSPLTHTQMADLPQTAPNQTYMGAGAASMPPHNELKPGQKLAGRYEVRELIGSGGMGAVYKAFDPNRDKEIAIKVLLPHLLNNDRARERFLQEARLSSEMSHPNIVTVFDVQQEGNTFFLTMELLQGQPLRELMQQRAAARHEFSAAEVVDLIEPICGALAYAHERTVHRDIKPENIWVTPEGKAKVMDFGIARLMSNTQSTHTQVGVGTAYYMAPEQLTGRGAIDGRADQYAVAVMLYEMLAGHVPVGRIDPLGKLRRDIPRSLSDAVDKALSGRPQDRFETMAEFAAALRKKSSFSPGTFTNVEALLQNPRTRYPALIAGAALALAVVFAGGQYIRTSSALKGEYARMEGEAGSLLKEVQGKAQQLERDLESARRSQKDREESVAKVSSQSERIDLIKEVLAMELRSGDLKAALNSFDTTLHGGDDLSTIEGQLREADEAQRSGNTRDAVEKLRPALERLQALKASASMTMKARQEGRSKLLESLQGNWAVVQGLCEQSMKIVSNDMMLHMDGSDEMVTGFDGDAVQTMVIAPDSQYGSQARYLREGNTLKIRQGTSTIAMYLCP